MTLAGAFEIVDRACRRGNRRDLGFDMKNPQGREAKKPKKAKVKTPPRVFDDAIERSPSQAETDSAD